MNHWPLIDADKRRSKWKESALKISFFNQRYLRKSAARLTVPQRPGTAA
jgi:hypothetical protein